MQREWDEPLLNVRTVHLMEAHPHVLLSQGSLTVTSYCFSCFASGHDFMYFNLLYMPVSLPTLHSGRSLCHRRIMQILLWPATEYCGREQNRLDNSCDARGTQHDASRFSHSRGGCNRNTREFEVTAL